MCLKDLHLIAVVIIYLISVYAVWKVLYLVFATSKLAHVPKVLFHLPLQKQNASVT